jgi:hypothetical protein
VAPLPDPTIAVELFPDVLEATRQARHTAQEEYAEGDVVLSWRG